MDPDYQSALVQGQMGNLNGGSGASPQALVQGLLGSFGGSGNYLDPQKATPDMIKSQLAYGEGLMNGPKEIHRPWEGINEMVRALLGGGAIHDANTAQQGALANADQQKQALIQGLQNGASTPPSPAGSASNDGLPSPQQAADSYAQGAQARGIDPNVALKVFGGESNFNVAAAGDPDASGHNTSFGVSQLHYGSAGGGPNSGKGMGDEFTAATGLDARDPRNWQAVRDFTLDKVKAGGWGPWHAAQRAGIGNFDGIGGGSPDGGASASAPNGFTHPTAQALAAYKAPIDPKLAADIMTNPWQDEATKSLVMQALNPSIVEDSLGNKFYHSPGQNPTPYLAGGKLANLHTGNVDVPLVVGGSPANPHATILPGSGQSPGGPTTDGPLPPSVAALSDQGARIGAHAGAVGAVGSASGDQYAQDQKASGDYARRIYPLQQAIPALEQLGTTGTGPGTTQLNEVKSFLQSLGIPGFDSSKIEGFDRAKKYLVDYVRQGGGTGTDNQLAAAFSGNPNMDVSNAAAVDVAKSALALQRMQQAKFLSADATRPESYGAHASEFAQQQDPRAYGLDLMSPEARAKLNASMAPGSPERARFLSSLAMAKKTGVLQPLGGQ